MQTGSERAGGTAISDEARLLAQALDDAGGGFADDTVRLGLLRGGVVHFVSPGPAPSRALWGLIGEATSSGTACEADDPDLGHALVFPLVVDGECAGVLTATRSPGRFRHDQRALLRLIARQLATGMENARLYRQLDGLFSEYLSREVANVLLADPDRAELGGATRDISVLFADLRGFTSFSERYSPQEVVGLLNRYFGAAVPAIIEQGGTIANFIGDAVMAIFNAPTHQPEHPLLAARAALELQRVVGEIAAEDAARPLFRVGVNTGPALVGNIGSTYRRLYTAIGDAVNVAARLEGLAGAGEVVIGEETYYSIRPVAETRPLGALTVKGRAEPVRAFVLTGLRDTRSVVTDHTLRIDLGWGEHS